MKIYALVPIEELKKVEEVREQLWKDMVIEELKDIIKLQNSTATLWRIANRKWETIEK